MRLPRVRFTVGSLLLIIAVVAANCWGIRHLCDGPPRYRYVAGSISYRVLPAGLGVLPLVNIAMIGTMLLAARRLRLLRSARTTVPQPSRLSGFVHFSLHFLMLGWLVSLFTPDLIDRYRDMLETVTAYAATGWAHVIGQPKETVPWILFDCTTFGLFISGPPLLVSWIGHRLSTRCAATLPRRRFRVLTGLVELGFAGTALAICLTPQPFEEEQAVVLDLRVIDQDSGRPIGAAFLCVTDAFSSFDSLSSDQDARPDACGLRAFTDVDGRARLTGQFEASGDCNAFQTMGAFSPWGRWLEVSASGYRTVRIPLPQVLGPRVDLDRPGLGTVALIKGRTPEGTFRKIAGIYSTGFHGFGGYAIEIVGDGRYARFDASCSGTYQEYGKLEWHDGEIQFVPILHPGTEMDELRRRHRTIEWGDRMYLSATDDRELQGYCEAVLTPNSGDWYTGLPRLSDQHKPRTGLPRLPARIWITFLLDKIKLRDEDGRLRLALESLIPRNRR